MITLIANTGVQFYEFRLDLDLDQDIPKEGLTFQEFISEETNNRSLGYAYRVDDDIYTSKEYLELEGLIDEYGEIDIDRVDLNNFAHLSEIDLIKKPGKREGYFKYNDLEESLNFHEDNWLPFPYFKNSREGKSELGPYGWARIFLRRISEESRKYRVILAFDTSINSSDTYVSPLLSDTVDGDNHFSPCNDDSLFLKFCDESYSCGRIQSCLDTLKEVRKKDKEKSEQYHIARYIYLLNYLCNLDEIFLSKKIELEEQLKYSPTNRHIAKQILDIDDKLRRGFFPDITLLPESCIAPIDVDWNIKEQILKECSL